MTQKLRRISFLLVLVLLLFTGARSQGPAPAAKSQPAAAPPSAPDLTREPTLYVVPYAHLDTQWRWEYPQVIREYLTRTMRDNFALFESYPHYVFNFSGANRYRMMREYYPADYEKLKQYVAAGRWFPSGSSMEENDVNNPSAESIIRQVLYGKQFFRRDFGKTSAEYMLPDCFGFPASLPSHPGAHRHQGFLDAETLVALGSAGRRTRFAAEDAARHPVQRRDLGGHRRPDHHRRAERHRLQRRRHRRHQQEPAAGERPRLPSGGLAETR